MVLIICCRHFQFLLFSSKNSLCKECSNRSVSISVLINYWALLLREAFIKRAFHYANLSLKEPLISLSVIPLSNILSNCLYDIAWRHWFYATANLPLIGISGCTYRVNLG